MRTRSVRLLTLATLMAGLVATTAGCGPLASFVRTGPTFAPRAEDAPVAVFLTRGPDRPYTEIGVVEVSGGDLAWRVDEAKYAARERGGDALILFRSSTEVKTRTGSDTVDVEVDGDEDRSSQTIQVEVPVTETSTYQRDLFVVARLGS